MLYIRNISLLSLGLLISCVTINVYFPAAEAEKAADQVIKNVWERQTNSSTPSFNKFDPNFKTSSPRSNALQAKMTQRHQKLKMYYNNGAIGLTNNAFIIVLSPIKIPLKKRNHVNQLVEAENKDRLQLYREIALINAHPEWVQDIRTIFASRWIKLASKKWIYQNSQGEWQTK